MPAPELTPEQEARLAAKRAALRPDDQRVLAALESECRATGACVTVAAVTAGLDDDARNAFAVRAKAGPSAVVRGVLRKLDTLRLIASPGFVGQERVYGLYHTPVQGDVTERPADSVRSEVLAMVRGAAEAEKRPVRIRDVCAFGGTRAKEIGSDVVAKYLVSLVTTKDVVVQAEGHGRRSGGTKHYLSADLVDKYGAAKPVESFNDTVLVAFRGVWEEHVKAGMALKEKPEAVLLSEVVARVQALLPDADSTQERVQVVLRGFEGLQRPHVVRLQLGVPPVNTWYPSNVVRDEVNDRIYHASDCRRAAEAILRASALLNHHAIAGLEAHRECAKDSTLAMQGASTLFTVLDSAARKTLARPGRRSVRATPYLTALGCAEGVAYYCIPDRYDQAMHEMSLRWIIEREDRSVLAEEVSRISEAGDHGMRSARAEMAVRSCMVFAAAYARFAADTRLADDLRQVATERAAGIECLIEALKAEYSVGCSERFHGVESELVNFQTLTGREFAQIGMALIGHAGNSRGRGDAAKLLDGRVRQLPNPKYAHRNTGNPDTSSEWTYDRVAAFMMLAEERGGPECRVSAQLARMELGQYREADAVLAALANASLEVRSTAVAASAFIGGQQILAALLKIIREDEMSAVRLAAVWSYGFANDGNGAEALKQAVATEPDLETRMAMEAMVAEADGQVGGWWRV